MPLPPPPSNPMLAQLMARKQQQQQTLPAAAQQQQPSGVGGEESKETASTTKWNKNSQEIPSVDFHNKPFVYDESKEAFLFAAHYPQSSTNTTTGNDVTKGGESKLTSPCLVSDRYGNEATDVCIPLGQCVYRMTDYTYAKKEPIELTRCVLKLGVLRCLDRECESFNKLLWNRYGNSNTVGVPMEEDEIGKIRFMELLSNCGIFQKVSELIVRQIVQSIDRNKAKESIHHDKDDDDNDDGDDVNVDEFNNPWRVPQIIVDGLKEFLQTIEQLVPTLREARDEIEQTQSVRFYPGLGELYPPGSRLTCFPEGMEGTPLGCQVVQCWYDEEFSKATNKMKRKFVLVIEFIVSVGDELVFVAASDVYPEFHDPNRNVPIKDLKHRRLFVDPNSIEDKALLERMQARGEFYASVAVKNHYLEYYPNSFYPIIGGGWSSGATVRPLSKGGRVMVDVKRGILEGHIPVRGTSSDGMSDTVKEAIKLFEQSKRTGVAVPFRTCILPGFHGSYIPKPIKTKTLLINTSEDAEDLNAGDRSHLWQAWPMLTGFSFTARVWGKLLLGMPKQEQPEKPLVAATPPIRSPRGGEFERRPSVRKFGGAIEVGGLGGVGKCGNCGYIKFQEQAFEQLVLAEDKKELVRAVARNAGGGTASTGVDNNGDDGDDDDDDDDDDAIGIDVVANKGGASIFLLHGPPGTGKTLTAEAIAELLRKPLYVVTAGDLGITASEVEKTLGSVLELCQTWDALVLIDEADVFLEARDSHEIQRNALVCVMLRLLEYYSGCLFLSSNRSASSIDSAIASRITVMLHYPQLDSTGRAKVWKNLIELIPIVPSVSSGGKKQARYRTEFVDTDYESLAAGYNLNGRQIKNSIVLARALARERNTPLSIPIIRRAVTAVAGEGAVIDGTLSTSVPGVGTGSY